MQSTGGLKLFQAHAELIADLGWFPYGCSTRTLWPDFRRLIVQSVLSPHRVCVVSPC